MRVVKDKMKSKTSLSVFQTYFIEVYHSYLTRFSEDSFVQNQVVLTQNKFAVSSPRCMSAEPRYYISLMDVAQNLIFITSYYIYFKLLMILFSF